MVSNRILLVSLVALVAMGTISVQAASLEDVLRGIFKTCFGFPCVRGTRCVMQQLTPCPEGDHHPCNIPKQPNCIRLG